MSVNLLKPIKGEGYNKFARAMDWALFWASIPFTAWMFWSHWPKPDVWCWLCLAAIPVGFLMARFAWQDALTAFLHARMPVKRKA